MATCSTLLKRNQAMSRNKMHWRLPPLAGKVFIRLGDWRGLKGNTQLKLPWLDAHVSLTTKTGRVARHVLQCSSVSTEWTWALWTDRNFCGLSIWKMLSHVNVWSCILWLMHVSWRKTVFFSLFSGGHTGSLRYLCPDVKPRLSSFERAHAFIAWNWLQGDQQSPSTQWQDVSSLW